LQADIQGLIYEATGVKTCRILMMKILQSVVGWRRPILRVRPLLGISFELSF